jgi:hypothetical protein
MPFILEHDVQLHAGLERRVTQYSQRLLERDGRARALRSRGEEARPASVDPAAARPGDLEDACERRGLAAAEARVLCGGALGAGRAEGCFG